jgi:hypothetical protein
MARKNGSQHATIFLALQRVRVIVEAHGYAVGRFAS